MHRVRARSGVRPTVAALATFAVVAIAACGDSGGGGGSGYREPKGPAQETITVKGGNFFFDPSDIMAPAGVSAIELESEAGLHDLVFDNGKVPDFRLEASSGNSDELKVDLEPGEYTIYCDIPGHREGGMEGTITVR
jgi:plastocyanin